jgi:hypothetical protein
MGRRGGGVTVAQDGYCEGSVINKSGQMGKLTLVEPRLFPVLSSKCFIFDVK